MVTIHAAAISSNESIQLRSQLLVPQKADPTLPGYKNPLRNKANDCVKKVAEEHKQRTDAILAKVAKENPILPTKKELIELAAGTGLTAIILRTTLRAGAVGAAAGGGAIILVNSIYRDAAEQRELRSEKERYKKDLQDCKNKYGMSTIGTPFLMDSRYGPG